MSGSGGNFFGGSKKPREYAQSIRQEEEKARDDAYSVEVQKRLNDVLVNANDRDTDTIQTHLNTIKKALERDIEGTIDIRYGGSVSKNTYVDGISDVDALAILNDTELEGKPLPEVKEYFITRLRQRLPDSKIEQGKLAVTVTFTSGFEIQILPALRTKEGLRIPSSYNQNRWSGIIEPKRFVESLRAVNIKMSGKLIPVIKLAKTLIASFPDQRQLTGYHVEALAMEIFSKYDGPLEHRKMLQHFFAEGARQVLRPMKDATNQSTNLDSYLQDANSIRRKMVADSMSTAARKMQNADGSKQLRIWDDLLT